MTTTNTQGISEQVLLERVERAIEDDLQRQVNVQSGCEYHRADESGVASASMNIVVSDVARAAIAALRGSDNVSADELRAERDALLQRPIDLAKMDSIDDDATDRMIAYYWHEQAQIARDELASLRTVPSNVGVDEDALKLRRVASQLRTYSDMRGADEVERIASRLSDTARENVELKHDLERQMTIANIECNEAEKAKADTGGLIEALEEARFLCARLREFEGVCDNEECCREYGGHVSPSLARMETALASSRGVR